jgi:hypothetical protein
MRMGVECVTVNIVFRKGTKKRRFAESKIKFVMFVGVLFGGVLDLRSGGSL